MLAKMGTLLRSNSNQSETELCFFCEKNSLQHTYPCCHKQCCKSCYETYFNINKNCPWCRQDPSLFVNNIKMENTYDNILLFFEAWLDKNKIKRNNKINNCINHIKTMDLSFQNQKSKTVDFQVAYLTKIHVFRYKNYKEISFKYHEKWDLIEVKGGDYYLYGNFRNSDNFGWWLHGFVKEI